MPLTTYTSFLDLPDLRRVFSQRPLLTSHEFRREWKKRIGWNLQENQLEALHRSGLLTPVLRLGKPVSAIMREAKRSGQAAYDGLVYEFNDPVSIENARQEGRLFDPREEGFTPWRRYRRMIDQVQVRTAEHFYSWYQLAIVDQLNNVVRVMTSQRTANGKTIFRLPAWHEQAALHWDPDLRWLLLLSLADASYRPRILGQISLPAGGEDEWRRWVSEFDPGVTTRRVRISPREARDRADAYFARARFRDPQADWWPLMRLARPEKWGKLEGAALQALDNRIAGEVLLLLYEDLVSLGAAEPLPGPDDRYWEPRRERLTADVSELDEVLSDFGLSPHPAVVLILEGETEETLLPLVQDKLGFHPSRSQMEVICVHGVGGDVASVASYAAAPASGREVPRGVLLNRPLTHILVAVDPEGGYETVEGREEKRRFIVERILARLEVQFRTDVVRKQLDGLVSISTWGIAPFEFAHFTDGELARAVNRLHKSKYGKAPARPTRAADVKRQRHFTPSVEKLPSWRNLSKVELAKELMPVLARRLDRAIADNRIQDVPFAEVVLEAAQLVSAYSRRRFMLATELAEQPQTESAG